ncbi:LOW QUALITY PROTEIN: hypothetical protein NC653_011502 [Populus alba x Populus x berolinensis]|uniref:Uncharacterized protein n=1 Tax=Populus alba x Populus x berolinensis TaxID=444605 RepID=A0AAD6W6G1_9ROSI|nr:LOW QUALITY PROTEIN: hypothetical protein NC653_011502 [Populus alba x Populus x berolinensis]
MKKKNSELTRTNRNPLGQGPSAAWTVEKHRLYLDSLEASFVNKQLRHSFSLRCWWREMGGRPCSSQPQFMVLRHCRWEKKMNEPLLESTADSRRQLGGQTGGRRLIMIFKDTLLLVAGGFGECNCLLWIGKKFRITLHVLLMLSEFYWQHHRYQLLCKDLHHYRVSSSVISDTWSQSNTLVMDTCKVSDQNFVEEHQGEELTCIHMLKRSGRSGAGASRNDKKI